MNQYNYKQYLIEIKKLFKRFDHHFLINNVPLGILGSGVYRRSGVIWGMVRGRETAHSGGGYKTAL